MNVTKCWNKIVDPLSWERSPVILEYKHYFKPKYFMESLIVWSTVKVRLIKHSFVALLWSCEFNCVILLSFFLISYSLLRGLYFLFSCIGLAPEHDNSKLVNIRFNWAWLVSEGLDVSLREEQYFPKFLWHLLHRSICPQWATWILPQHKLMKNNRYLKKWRDFYWIL